MQTEDKDRHELIGLLAKWSNLLPKDGEPNPVNLASLQHVGKEIQELCSQVESQQVPSIKPESVEPEQDFKPCFVFQLKSDQAINPQQEQFECVFDFCQRLETYCLQSLKKNLSIEKDWLKLLLACSSNNYERFMWIHLTFQAANQLKLNWSQVKKRLMCKFDLCSRPATVLNLISNFVYSPNIETIEMANIRFSRLAAEAQIDVTDAYLLGLPVPIRDIIASTMDYDATTSFHCALEDVQQRAVVFITANEDHFVFYSKTAHIALHLQHEKVNQQDCEFHLLANHSTSNCPDFVIVKYPYMPFTPLTGVPKLHSPTILTKYIHPRLVENNVSDSMEVDQPEPSIPESSMQAVEKPMAAQAVEKPVPAQAVEKPVAAQAVEKPVPAAEKPVPAQAVEQPVPTQTAGQSMPAQPVPTQVTRQPMPVLTQAQQPVPTQAVQPAPTQAQQPMQAVQPVPTQAQHPMQAVQPAPTQVVQPVPQKPMAFQNLVASPRPAPSHPAPLPLAVPAAAFPPSRSVNNTVTTVLPVKEEERKAPEKESTRSISGVLSNTTSDNIPSQEQILAERIKSMTSLQIVEMAKLLGEKNMALPPMLTERIRLLREEMLSQKSNPIRPSSYRQRRSPSIEGQGRYSRSPSPNISDSKGCYVHGKHVSHVTKNCRQAQMVISSYSQASSRSESPHGRRHITESNRKDAEENICIFCKLPFKPGHLGYCKEVRGKKKTVRRR